MQTDLTHIAEELPIKFFTRPPDSVLWSYVLINAHRPDWGLRYLKKWGTGVREVIVDSGVEIFRDRNVKDYPGGYRAQAKRVLAIAKRVKDLCPKAEVWVTTPDYPDDYSPGSLWLSSEVTNIERTIESIMYCTREYPSEQWLISLQAHYGKPESVRVAIRKLSEVGFDFNKHEYYACALTCQYKSVKTIVTEVHHCIDELRKYITNFRLHLFGPHIRVVPHLVRIVKTTHIVMSIDRAGTHSADPNDPWRRYYVTRFISFDSTSYTKPVNELVLKVIRATKRFSCKSEAQRQIYFTCYVARLCELCNRHDLASEVLKKIGIEKEYGTLVTYLQQTTNPHHHQTG